MTRGDRPDERPDADQAAGAGTPSGAQAARPSPAKRPKRRPTGAAIGGILAGFDQQVFRTQPPAHELVHHARPDDPVPSSDGGRLYVTLPTDTGAPDAPDADGPARPVDP